VRSIKTGLVRCCPLKFDRVGIHVETRWVFHYPDHNGPTGPSRLLVLVTAALLRCWFRALSRALCDEGHRLLRNSKRHTEILRKSQWTWHNLRIPPRRIMIIECRLCRTCNICKTNRKCKLQKIKWNWNWSSNGLNLHVSTDLVLRCLGEETL
jgi:hypothetical protein